MLPEQGECLAATIIAMPCSSQQSLLPGDPVGAKLVVHVMRPGRIRVLTRRADRDDAGETGMAMQVVVAISVARLGAGRGAGDGG